MGVKLQETLFTTTNKEALLNRLAVSCYPAKKIMVAILRVIKEEQFAKIVIEK